MYVTKTRVLTYFNFKYLNARVLFYDFSPEPLFCCGSQDSFTSLSILIELDIIEVSIELHNDMLL